MWRRKLGLMCFLGILLEDTLDIYDGSSNESFHIKIEEIATREKDNEHSFDFAKEFRQHLDVFHDVLKFQAGNNQKES
jgi:hypothetical protein